MDIENVELHLRDNSVGLTLLYPRQNKVKFIEINLSDVRANDGIRLWFDYDRDGWVIEQPTKFSWEADEIPDQHWKEIAFVEGWTFLSEEEEEKLK